MYTDRRAQTHYRIEPRGIRTIGPRPYFQGDALGDAFGTVLGHSSASLALGSAATVGAAFTGSLASLGHLGQMVWLAASV
jgi:hypothetical protein